jgi:hypothetical protein
MLTDFVKIKKERKSLISFIGWFFTLSQLFLPSAYQAKEINNKTKKTNNNNIKANAKELLN